MSEQFLDSLPKGIRQRQLLNPDVRKGVYQGTEFWLHTIQKAKGEGKRKEVQIKTPYGKFEGNVWTSNSRQVWELVQRTRDGREILVIGASVRSSNGQIDLFEIKKDPDGLGYWSRSGHTQPLKKWGGTQYDYIYYEEPVDFMVMFLERDKYRNCQRPEKTKRKKPLRYEFGDSREPYQTL